MKFDKNGMLKPQKVSYEIRYDELRILKTLTTSFENLYSNLMQTKEKIDKLNLELQGDNNVGR